jgi:hypothetical protein
MIDRTGGAQPRFERSAQRGELGPNDSCRISISCSPLRASTAVPSGPAPSCAIGVISSTPPLGAANSAGMVWSTVPTPESYANG